MTGRRLFVAALLLFLFIGSTWARPPEVIIMPSPGDVSEQEVAACELGMQVARNLARDQAAIQHIDGIRLDPTTPPDAHLRGTFFYDPRGGVQASTRVQASRRSNFAREDRPIYQTLVDTQDVKDSCRSTADCERETTIMCNDAGHGGIKAGTARVVTHADGSKTCSADCEKNGAVAFVTCNP